MGCWIPVLLFFPVSFAFPKDFQKKPNNKKTTSIYLNVYLVVKSVLEINKWLQNIFWNSKSVNFTLSFLIQAHFFCSFDFSSLFPSPKSLEHFKEIHWWLQDFFLVSILQYFNSRNKLYLICSVLMSLMSKPKGDNTECRFSLFKMRSQFCVVLYLPLCFP